MSRAQVPSEDERLVRYLLGDLSEEQEMELEKDFFDNDELFERLLAVEADLTDTYVRGEMAAADRERFEQRCLSTPRRRRKAEFAQTLAELIAEPRTHSEAPLARRVEGPPAARTGAFALSLAVAALFLIAIGGLVLRLGDVQRDKELLQKQLAAAQERVADLNQQNRRLAAKLREEPLQVRPPELGTSLAQNGKGVRKATSRTTSFLLIAGLRDSGDANRFTIPRDTETILLKMPLEQSEYRTYSASVQRASGSIIWKRDRLRAVSGKNGEILVLEIPAKLLQPGGYIVEVRGEGRGKSEDVAGYSFQILSS